MRSLVAITVLVTGLLVMVAPPGLAQPDDEPTSLRMHLAQIDGVLSRDPDATLSATLNLDTGPVARRNLRLVTTVYSRVTDGEALSAALAGGPGTVYSSVSTDLPDLAAGTSRLHAFSVPRTDLSLDLDGPVGVFPVQFGVFQSGQSVGSITSAIVVLPEDAPPPLPASMVASVTADALPMEDTVAPPSLEAAVAPDSSLVRQTRDLVEAAEDGSAAGLTLVLSGRLLADLDRMADGYSLPDGGVEDVAGMPARRAAAVLDRVRRLAARADTDVLALPHGPADIVALVRGGQPGEAVRLTDVGRVVTAEVIGEQPTAGIVVPPDGVDAATVAALGPTQPDAFLLAEHYLAFADDGGLQPVRRLRTADGGEIRILMPDDALSTLLQDPRGLGVAAVIQRVRAQTALRWLDPDAPSSSAVLLDLTAVSDPPAGMIPAVNDMLADAAWLRPMTLSALADRVPPADRVVRLAYPSSSRAAELDADYIQRLGEAREALVPIRALLPATADAASDFGRSLLVAAALPYRDIDFRAAGLDRIIGALNTLTSLANAIEVIDGPPITLTSTTGEIPLTLRNTADVPLNVQVRLGSTGFEFDNPTSVLTVPAQSVQTLTFRARALNPGGIAGVGVVVQDPTGAMALVETTLAVRSTAFPIVAVIAVVGGCLFLVFWGVRGNRRRRNPTVVAAADRDESVA